MRLKNIFKKLVSGIREINYLYWSPRVLGIAIILFLGLFALDVIEPGRSLRDIIVGLFMHLIPNFILLVILMVAWKKEDIGGLLFMLAGIYMWLYFENPFLVNLMLFGPIFLIGLLFLSDAYVRSGGLKLKGFRGR